MPKYTPNKFTYKPNYTVPSFSSPQFARETAKQKREALRLEELREEEERRRIEEYLLQGRRSGTLPLRSARRKDELAYVSSFGQRPTPPNRFAYNSANLYPTATSGNVRLPVAKRKKRSTK